MRRVVGLPGQCVTRWPLQLTPDDALCSALGLTSWTHKTPQFDFLAAPMLCLLLPAAITCHRRDWRDAFDAIADSDSSVPLGLVLVVPGFLAVRSNIFLRTRTCNAPQSKA